MTQDNRPLSPHLQIYKIQITAFTSILHRITGIALYLGLVLLCGLITYYTYQINIFEEAAEICDCPITRTIIYVVMLGFAFSLYYHLFNGIRHLFWDFGKGFDIKTTRKSGVVVLIASALLTLASAYFVFLS